MFISEEEYLQYLIDNVISAVHQKCMLLINSAMLRDAELVLAKANELLTSVNQHNISVLNSQVLLMNIEGCLLKRQGKLEESAAIFLAILEKIKASQSPQHLGITYINLCAVYDRLQDNVKSLEFAEKSVIQLHTEYK